MGDSRLVMSTYDVANSDIVNVTTYQRDEQTFEGVWSKQRSTPLLTFIGSQTSGSTLKRFNGPIAGALEGHPLYFIYWGSWWNGPGKGQLDALVPQLEGLMKSVYFDQLKQYGISHAPNLAGSVVVTTPEPPISRSFKKTCDDILDLIKDLVADDKLPNNMGSPKPLYMVMTPDTFTLTQPIPGVTVLGAHPISYSILPPINGEYWVGWTRPELGNPDAIVRTLSHEIVETLTDPEYDGWKWEPPTGIAGTVTEMSDGLWASSGPNSNSKQTAFVNNASVESYWSNLHNAPVIPIDSDYAARLRATMVENRHAPAYEGTFVPGPKGAPLCSAEHSECCYGDRTFKWTRFEVDETARVRAITRRYRTPMVSWKINDQQLLAASGTLTVSVNLTTFDDNRNPSVNKTNVNLTWTLVPSAGPGSPAGLNISSTMEGNFSVFVKATVT